MSPGEAGESGWFAVLGVVILVAVCAIGAAFAFF